jgi:hypothetical protein
VGSPFWNIFTWFYLGPLQPDEADMLIREPALACRKPFSDDQVSEISLLGGLHPFFLNIACTYAFNGERGEELKFQFQREAHPHFEYLLNQLDKSDIKVLRECAADPSRTDRRILTDLQRRGLLVVRPNGTLGLFSSALAELLLAGDGPPSAASGKAKSVTVSWLGRSSSRKE